MSGCSQMISQGVCFMGMLLLLVLQALVCSKMSELKSPIAGL